MNVFISYRRDDTRDMAGRIYDKLKSVPNIRHIFYDVEEIAYGEDFNQRIKSILTRKPVCVLLIGPAWSGPRPNAPPRILDPDDTVRFEAASALESASLVIPVLVNQASMPRPQDLPPELAALSNINAYSIRHEYFSTDFPLLVDAILQKKAPTGIALFFRDHPIVWDLVRTTLTTVGALALLVVAAALHSALTGSHAISDEFGQGEIGEGATYLLVCGVFVVGIILGILTRPRWRGARGRRRTSRSK